MTPMGPPARWEERWHLTGAGVENVWHYLREVLACPSGRLLLRGPNGTGKTTLLEALLPYLLNPKASALSSGRNRATSLESLMKAGSTGRRRTGYLWLSFTAPGGRDESGSEADEVHYGVRLEYAQGCNPAVVVVPFWAPVLPGSDRDNFSELDRDEFTGWLTSCGGEVFACPDDYVTHLAQSVFDSTDRRGTLLYPPGVWCAVVLLDGARVRRRAGDENRPTCSGEHKPRARRRAREPDPDLGRQTRALHRDRHSPPQQDHRPPPRNRPRRPRGPRLRRPGRRPRRPGHASLIAPTPLPSSLWSSNLCSLRGPP